MCQKQLRQALLLILLSVSDDKRGYTSLYFIIPNFRTELNLSHGMNSLAFAPYTMFANNVAIGTPYCFDQVQLKVSFLCSVFYAVSLICTDAFLWLAHQKLD